MSTPLYTKESLLQDFNLLLFAFRFDHFSTIYVASRYNSDIKNQTFDIHRNGEDMFQIKGEEFDAILSNDDHKREFVNRITGSYRNLMISEGYEWVKKYCNKSSELNLKKFLGKVNHKYSNTLNYIRVLRNCMNHWDGPYEIDWPFTSLNEVSWGKRTIRKGMVGNDVRIGSKECIDLIKELYAFIKEELE